MNDGRPKLLSRRFWLWRLALGLVVPALFSILLDRGVRLPGEALQRRIEFRLLIAAFNFAVLVGVLRLLEGKTLSESGLFARERWRQRFGAGLLLGAAPLLLHAGALALAGLYSFSLPGTASLAEALGLSLVLLVAGLDEEVRYRALLLRPIDEGLGSVIAMGTSAVVFGLSHAGNEGATAPGIAVITVGGVLLAALYLKSRSLWLAVGFHWAWNLVMGVGLGLPVSGTRLPSLLAARVEGPALWTGGSFGPEASALIAGLVVVATTAAVWSAAAAGALFTPPWLGRALARLGGALRGPAGDRRGNG